MRVGARNPSIPRRNRSARTGAASGLRIAMKSGQEARRRKEHAMMFALALALVGVVVIKTLELVANLG